MSLVAASFRRWLRATEHRRGTMAMDVEENPSKSQGHTMMTRAMRRIVGSLVASSWRSPLPRPGAKVFGRITVGHYVKIDVNALIYQDIPNMAVAA